MQIKPSLRCRPGVALVLVSTIIMLVLLCGAALHAQTSTSGSPAAPPVKLATNGEAGLEFTAQTAQAFLPLLDISRPEMAKVKAFADQRNWAGALDAYRDLLFDVLKKGGDSTEKVVADRKVPDGTVEMLKGTLWIGRQARGFSINHIGQPGAIDWFKIGVDRVEGEPAGVAKSVHDVCDLDYCTHLSQMKEFLRYASAYHKLVAPVAGPQASLARVSDQEALVYLRLWLGTWEDFARRHKAGYAEVVKQGRLNDYNALGASQFQQLYISFRLQTFCEQIRLIAQAMPPEHYRELSSTALACVLTELVANHMKPISSYFGGAPNQAGTAISALMETIRILPGLKMGPVWEQTCRERVVKFYQTMNLPDGTNTEQAINYNSGNVNLLVKMMKHYPERPAWIQALVPSAEQTLVYLTSMLRNGSHPGSWPRWGCDDRTYEERLRSFLEYLPNRDVERIVARVYGREDKGDPSFTSIQFPYSGYYALRAGWRKEDAFCIFKASPRAGGHGRDDNNSFFLGAFGRDLLVDAGSGTYSNHPINHYLKGTFSKNSIAVDGKSQARKKIGDGNRGAIATAEHPLANRFHTSATFDVAEGFYDAGYEDPKIEVRHERQVVFLRDLALWVITDRLRGEMKPMPAGETHTYTQVWNFDDSFAKEQVKTDEAQRRVWSADPKGANVALYYFGAAPLTYKKWYGEVLPDGTHRGWVRDNSAEAKAPKVDVHAIWTGKGEQLLVTLIEARKDDKSRISKIEPLGVDGVQGFRATLADGQVITYQAALNEAPLKAGDISLRGSVLLTLGDAAGTTTRGIALDAREWTAAGRQPEARNFEFGLRDGNLTDVQEIRYPEGAVPPQPGLVGDTVQDAGGNGHDVTMTDGKFPAGVQGKANELGARGCMRAPIIAEKVNWPEFMARHDLVWTKAPHGISEAIALGNGQLGASLDTDGNALVCTLHRQDITDQRPFRPDSWDSPLFETCRLRIGEFQVKPVGKIQSFNARLVLWDALNTGTIQTDKGKISWRAFVHATLPLVILEFTTEGDEKDFVCEWKPASNSSPRWELFKNRSNAPRPDYEPNPPVTVEKQGAISVSVHPLKVGKHFAAAWTEQRPSETQRLIVATVMPVSDHAKQEAVKTLQAVNESVDGLLKSHCQRWHERYPVSFVSVPDTRTESHYWINIYKLYCATRPDQPPIDVHGMWMGGTGWPNIWWNMNIQLAYYCQATANRLELAESLCTSLERHVNNLSLNLSDPEWRADCAWVGRVTDQQLRSGGRLEGSEVANLSWAMECYWRQCRWAADDQRLKEKFLPLLEKCFNTYRHLFKEGPDGKLHLPETTSPEYGSAEDCNYDLGAVQWDLKTLIAESERLGINEGKIPEWKQFQTRLASYPRGPEGLWVGAKTLLERSHRHYSHLIAFYPLAILDWDNPGEREIIRRSVDYWQGLFADPARRKEPPYGYSYTGAASMYAWMEDGEKANAALQDYFDNRATPNAFYDEGTLEVGFSVCQSVHDFLLQSRRGVIRVFPAVPAAWKDAVFHNLRAEGAFLVSAARKDGKTQWVRVKSLAGEPCRLRIDGKEQTIKLAKGEEIVLGAQNGAVEAVPADPKNCNYYGKKK